MPVVSLTCCGCGVRFERASYDIRGPRSYCSHPCYVAHQRVGYSLRGYRAFTVQGKAHLEHRLVAERELGRKLLPTEDVHHANGQKADNRPENLVVLDHGKHVREHKPLSFCIATAERLLREGWSTKDVAQRLGVRPHTVDAALARRGLTLSAVRGRTRRLKVVPWDFQQVVDLLQQGRSTADVAARFGATDAKSVVSFLQRRGLTVRGVRRGLAAAER